VRVARALLRLARHIAPAWLLAILRADLERGYEDPTRATHSIERFVRPFSGAEGRAAFMQHLQALDSRETRALALRYAEIGVPTAVLWGANDPFLPLKLGRRLAEAIPGATLEVIPGARHFIPEDAPRPVADGIASLLTR
jgi:pimeloyl-ACP methyl ester carboxylesterase